MTVLQEYMFVIPHVMICRTITQTRSRWTAAIAMPNHHHTESLDTAMPNHILPHGPSIPIIKKLKGKHIVLASNSRMSCLPLSERIYR